MITNKYYAACLLLSNNFTQQTWIYIYNLAIETFEGPPSRSMTINARGWTYLLVGDVPTSTTVEGIIQAKWVQFSFIFDYACQPIDTYE